MQNLPIVAMQVGVLFALMGVGALSRLFSLVDEKGINGIVNILILIVTPSLIIDVFNRPFDSSMMAGFCWATFIALLTHIALIFLVRFYNRGGEASRPVIRLAIVFSNAGFMGIPLEQAILGAKGVFYGIAYVAIFNMIIWSWGLLEMRGEQANSSESSAKRIVKREMFLNPGTIGLIVGLPLFLFSYRLPQIIHTPISLLASLNTPLAMIVIGYYLARSDFRRVLGSFDAYMASFARLILSPLAMMAILAPFRSYFPREMMITLVLAASAPVAAMVSMFASKFSRDVELSVGLVSATTLLSIFTMPPIIALAMEIFP